jgi:RNAse (barnase) inhibitor barstar
MSSDAGFSLASDVSPVQFLNVTPEAAEALVRLTRSLGLEAVRIDLAGCADKAALLERTAAALEFPEWFGRNWDALFDCLADLSWRPATGHVLVFEHTAGLRREAPAALDTAVAILRETAAAWDERGRPFRAFVDAGGEAASDWEYRSPACQR